MRIVNRRCPLPKTTVRDRGFECVGIICCRHSRRISQDVHETQRGIGMTRTVIKVQEKQESAQSKAELLRSRCNAELPVDAIAGGGANLARRKNCTRRIYERLNSAVLCPKTRRNCSSAALHEEGSAITGWDQGTCDDGHNTRQGRRT